MIEENLAGAAPVNGEASGGQPAETPAPERDAAEADFPVVGVAASAGGLAPLQRLLAGLPDELEMALVIVKHLAAEHSSLLGNILEKMTSLPITEATDGLALQAGHIYIIPPGREMRLMHGRLHVAKAEAGTRSVRFPADVFFRSLAQDAQHRAIAVVLSGSGSDGTMGIAAIKASGGWVMAQDPATAEYRDMPRNAIATGLVDVVLGPEDLARQLVQFGRGGSSPRWLPPGEMSVPELLLEKVFMVLRDQTGQDFSEYKRSTVMRRLERRMAVNRVGDLGRYLRHLKREPEEAAKFARDLLIRVTSFFRDPEAFEALEERVLRRLVQDLAPGAALRIWVPGCCSGEEAYTVAMCVSEELDRGGRQHPVTIFATDIDATSIARARTGEFPAAIAVDIPQDRLERYFLPSDSGGYTVRKSLRDLIVFAEQNVLRDPPFPRLDLISCRNLLIYLSLNVQRRLLALFHYTLKPDGYLFLGSSESAGDEELFAVVDARWKIYRRRPDLEVRRRPTRLFAMHATSPGSPAHPPADVALTTVDSLRELTERGLLEQFAPAVLVTPHLEVRYLHGHTGRYLELPPGKISLNLAAMAREGLKLPLSLLVRRAIRDRVAQVRTGVPVQTEAGLVRVDLHVTPMIDEATDAALALVVFCEQPSEAGGPAAAGERSSTDSVRLAVVEHELGSSRAEVQHLVEEMEATSEELMSTNEELQSANEELQSTNEELQTSHEELQSVNEELVTVNTELECKVQELLQAHDDMTNLLANTHVASIYLDTDLYIERYTPSASEIVSLLPGDVGRPIDNLATRLVDLPLAPAAHRVLDDLTPTELEARGTDGRWYSVTLNVYRTHAHVIAGVVITFIDMTRCKRAEHELERLRRSLDQSDLLIVLVDQMGRLAYLNPAAAEVSGTTLARALGRRPGELPGRLADLLEREIGHVGGRRIRWTTTLITNDEGAPLGRLSIGQLTEAADAPEEQLARENALLRLLYGWSERLRKEHPDQAELTRGVCRDLVDQVGYQVAWFGLADAELPGGLTPAVWQGPRDQALSMVQGDGGDGGAVAVALTTNQAVRMQVLGPQRGSEDWQREAARLGYRSFVALPLGNGDGAFGVLCLFANHARAFVGTEMDLLTELTAEMAAALDPAPTMPGESSAT